MTSTVLEKTWLELFALAGTAAVPVIALIALAVAVWQIRSNSKAVRRASAYAIYHNYLKIAMDNPDVSFGNELKIRSNKENLAKYKWFASIMLLSFEEILAVCPNEEDWKATMMSQLDRHLWHLSVSSSVRSGHWRSDLVELIENTKKAGRRSIVKRLDLIPSEEYMIFEVRRG